MHSLNFNKIQKCVIYKLLQLSPKMSIFSTHKWNNFTKIGRKTSNLLIYSNFKGPQKHEYTSYTCGIPMKMKLRVSTFWKVYSENRHGSYGSEIKENIKICQLGADLPNNRDLIWPYIAVFSHIIDDIFWYIYYYEKNFFFSVWNCFLFLPFKGFFLNCWESKFKKVRQKKN